MLPGAARRGAAAGVPVTLRRRTLQSKRDEPAEHQGWTLHVSGSCLFGPDVHGSKLARPARFELTTPAFGGQYSIQLSYGRGGAQIT
jgi:hypothetical protein